MVKRMKALLDDEGGNSVIEAIFIVTLTVLFIFIVIILGFVYYQNILLQTVANQTAVSIARTYTYENKDPVTGYIPSANLHDLGFKESSYLLFGGEKNMKEAEEMKRLAGKLEKNNRLISYSGNSFIVDDKTKIRSSDAVMFQKEVVVVLEAKYYVPLAGFFGVDDGGKTIIRASGRALCADMMGLHSIDRTIDALVSTASDAAPFKIIQRITKCIENIFNASGNLVDVFLHEPEYESNTSEGGSGASGSSSGGGTRGTDPNSGGGSSGGSHSGGGGRLDGSDAGGGAGRSFENGGTSAGGNSGGGFR